MPRLSSCSTWLPGRSCRATREARALAAQPGFFSQFSPKHNTDYNYNNTLSRMSNMFEYGHITDRRPKPTSVQAQEPDPSDFDVIGVESVDFNIAQNTHAHHTSEYDITDSNEVAEPRLVVRRGQPFGISVTFNRAYDKMKDELTLVFQAGETPSPSKGTHIDVMLSDKDLPKQWGARIKSQRGKTLNMMVFTPPNCYVATWNFKLDVLKKKDEKKVIFRYNHKDQIYVLFNPWCKGDTVYMEGEREKTAYINNETGKIYIGSSNNITNKPWNFGQFQGDVLDCCMSILDESGMSWEVRGNPISVVRKITTAVSGVLTGNWSGRYEDGTSPLKWTGSVTILEQYYRTRNPVKYGQSWVFSGVTTTVLRALGIPARSVTNFASAHDTDGSITIDIHIDARGQPVDHMNNDSVWNFHVWNEVWMARPDIPSGCGGWQACDAVPKETSDGVYCCGPVPVLAIRRGEVNLPYDGQFMFAEVNADTVYWIVNDDGSIKRTYIQKNGVGKNISTQNMTDGDRYDVTNNYKFPEGSEEERVAVLKANQASTCHNDRGVAYDKGEQDVSFELKYDENKFVGENFELIIRIKNDGKESRTVSGGLSAKTMYYTGIPADLTSHKEFSVILKPGESKDEKLTVTNMDYQEKLKDMCMLQLTSMARVKETEQVFTDMQNFRLRKPHLVIKGPEEGKVGSPLAIQVSFMNPLTESLTSCVLLMDGPGLLKPTATEYGTVGPKQTFMTTVNFTPKKAGKRDLIVVFGSKQLDDINGTHTVKIQRK